MMLFTTVLGVVSFLQAAKIHAQTETMYNHPLQVRRTIGILETDILRMRLGARDMMLATSDTERQAILQEVEMAKSDAELQDSALAPLLGRGARISVWIICLASPALLACRFTRTLPA